jgi:hypothetical protein
MRRRASPKNLNAMSNGPNGTNGKKKNGKKKTDKTLNLGVTPQSANISLLKANPYTGRSTSYGVSGTKSNVTTSVSTTGKKGTTFSGSVTKNFKNKKNPYSFNVGATIKLGGGKKK